MTRPRTYFVTQRQTGEQTYLVEATSKADAIQKARNGDGDPVDFQIIKTGGCTAEWVATA